MKIKEKDYLSTREAANLLNVAVSTIQLWTDNGKLKAWTTVGGHRRIDKKSVAQMLTQQRSASNKENIKKSLSVVVVEDNEEEQKFYKKNFEDKYLNSNICIVKDGYEGLIYAGKILPDIIILDLMMPKLNDFELVEAIKQNADLKNSLLIAVSDLSEKELRMQTKLPSGLFVLNKPFSFDELDELLHDKFKINVA